ncbi:MAG: hypothetical protein PVG20_02350, partial [Thioalkalispiraceae bacterium]
WWLKPIYERVPLHIISRALFGEVDSLRDVIKAIPRLLFPHLIKSLTFYRFDPTRSFNLPIWQLEKLTGNARAERSRVLKKVAGSTALGLTFMCMILEVIIFSSLLGLVYMFSPEYYSDAITNVFLPDNGTQTWWGGLAINGFIYISYLVVGPFYVAGGFALYINRRTQLEGWDIEIAFRQMAQRLSQLGRYSSVAMLVIILGIGVVFSPIDQAHAEQTETENILSNAEAKKTIDEIMAQPAFKDTKVVKSWRNKNKKEEEEKEETEEESTPFQLPGLSLGIATIGEAILWILVVVLIVLAVVFYLRWSPIASTSNHKINKKLPKSLFGLEITPESLPDDVSQAAMELWKNKNPLVALSLLYRGALTTLVHRDGINLKGSATEGDCIHAVMKHDKLGTSGIDYFKELTTTWQYAAYAHRLPDESVMHDLSQRWQQFFGDKP